MKKLIALTIVVLVMVASNSGCRSGRSLFSKCKSCNPCNTCDSSSYGSYGSSGSDVIYEGGTMLPPPATTTVVPGPAPAVR